MEPVNYPLNANVSLVGLECSVTNQYAHPAVDMDIAMLQGNACVTLAGQDQIALYASRFQDVIGKMDIAISQWNVGVNMGIMGIFANMLIVPLAVIHSTAIAFARILVGVIQGGQAPHAASACATLVVKMVIAICPGSAYAGMDGTENYVTSPEMPQLQQPIRFITVATMDPVIA